MIDQLNRLLFKSGCLATQSGQRFRNYRYKERQGRLWQVFICYILAKSLYRDLNIKLSTFTIKQEVNVDYMLKQQIYALENNQLFYFPMCLIDEGDNQNLVALSSKQDIYLCNWFMSLLSYWQIIHGCFILDYIQGGKFLVNISLGVDSLIQISYYN
ncbi:hypothetical protein ABPG72_009058 [Tetrahymena utriculariae]